MARVPATMVQVSDVTLAYHEYGSGDPVIFINGLASAMDTWNPPLIGRISRDFRVIVFDNRGTGYSGASGEPFSVPLFTEDTAGLMEQLGIARAHVFGFSMGACIAQELAIMSPEKVDRLILVAGDCGGTEAVRTSPDILNRFIDKSGTMEEVADRMFPLLFPPVWLAAHDPFHSCPDVYETTSPENGARQLAAFSAWPGSFSRLGAIRSRTLVMAGDEDAVVPLENSRLISSRIPGAELVTFHGAGHGLMYQCPDRFSEQVIGFLER